MQPGAVGRNDSDGRGLRQESGAAAEQAPEGVSGRGRSTLGSTALAEIAEANRNQIPGACARCSRRRAYVLELAWSVKRGHHWKRWCVVHLAAGAGA